ncbi:neuroglobin-like [Mizuhopecten yessoensis]|uniref:Neuroglobin n=1 Tax=Mizuhopecten yessoensis TaxID=6573 RepID=A0A210QWK1_MIZYE|nr:neuroglobin-like [Mizuhopecten yessoensis]OWF53118.1 Neuroglobin [Mizuhopecten yessoensis]
MTKGAWMGCGSSRSRGQKNSKPEDGKTDDLFHQHLTDRQIHLVRDSWGLIQDSSSMEVGLSIYSSFFRSVENEILVLFPRVIRTEDGGESLGVDGEMLKSHAMRVMEGLDTIVTYLDEPAKLRTYLEHLGRQHHNSNVKARMLERLWPCIDDSFNACLGDVYLANVRIAWRSMMEFVISKMAAAMTEEMNKQRTAHVNGNGTTSIT